MPLTLVLGGARSGKSAYAEKLAASTGNQVIYIATAEVRDEGIKKRVSLHRQSRPSEWRTVESPLHLASTLEGLTNDDSVTILLDCLTMWVTNLLCAEDKSLISKEVNALMNLLPNLACDVILVSNEVGLGVIPMGELTRNYVDTAGKLHQEIAELADNVVLVVAGLPIAIKSPSV